MVNANHAAFDGFGALRLLQSVARSYAGDADPPPPVRLEEARDLERHLAAPDTATRVGRWRSLADKVCDLADAPARLAADGGSDRPGYGFHHVAVPSVDHSGPGTVNDVLLAALNLTVAGPNVSVGDRCKIQNNVSVTKASPWPTACSAAPAACSPTSPIPALRSTAPASDAPPGSAGGRRSEPTPPSCAGTTSVSGASSPPARW